jgi:hypothetical protein
MIYHYRSINGKEKNKILPVSCFAGVEVTARNRVRFRKISKLRSAFQVVIRWKQPPGVRRGGRGEPNATDIVAGGGRKRKIGSGRVAGFRGESGLILKKIGISLIFWKIGISLIFLENCNFTHFFGKLEFRRPK